MIKLSEQIRRLEDSIENLRAENKKLRDGKTPLLNYKWFIISLQDLPSKWNEEWDFYTYKIYDTIIDKTYIWKMVWYKNDWVDLSRIIRMEADDRDEIIDHQKWEISKLKEQIKKLTELNEQLTNTSDDGTKLIWQLKSELLARVKQVEDLQSSYKVLQEENEKLKSKLEQTVDEYDEDYQTFNRDDYARFDDNFRKIFWDFL